MANIKSEINQIKKALWRLQIEIQKTNEFLQLLWEYMHEDHILIFKELFNEGSEKSKNLSD